MSSGKWRPFCHSLNVFTHYLQNSFEEKYKYVYVFYIIHGLMPDGTKPLPKPMLIYNESECPAAFIWIQFHRKYSRYQCLEWF